MKLLGFEISIKGLVIGLILLLLSFVSIVLLSFIGGGIVGLGASEIMLLSSWVIAPIIMVLAGLSASYLGKYSKFSDGLITSIVLSIIYFIIVFCFQILSMPALAEIPGESLTSQINYSVILHSFIMALIFLVLGGVIGVFLFKRKSIHNTQPT